LRAASGNALANRRDPVSGFAPPILKALAVSLVPVALIFFATQLPGLQTGLLSTSLTGPQWLASIALALTLPLAVEVSKWDPPAPRAHIAAARRRASG